MGKQHNVVVPRPDGGADIFPMKQWLRRNPDALPRGLDASQSTSHQLRAALRSEGWVMEELPDQVLLIRPSANGTISYASSLIAEQRVDSQDTLEEEDAIAAEITFGLERDMQQALRSNISQLEPGLKIADTGTEIHTEAGRPDIIAQDPSGAMVVIELKAATALPDSVAQVLAYMATVAETYNRPVRGILVAKDFRPRVLLAARAVPNLRLRKYGFRFTFENADPPGSNVK